MKTIKKGKPKNFLGDDFNLPELEEKVLEFWREGHIFEKTLAAREGKKEFIFYEGPPYANGKPGIHHVLARIYKDIILRYKTMRGFSVPRRAGWDTHGLPVEIAAEKALGLKSKKDIEKYGIERFNEEAKKAVWLYKDEWEKMTERIGYWLDLKNPYITYEPKYIETLWWIISRIAKRKLLYKGHKVVPWCTRCGTALSSHELAQNYKETEDQSVYVKFKLTPQSAKRLGLSGPVYILSWTTTPWTLPGNVALAVKPTAEYIQAENKDGSGVTIMSESFYDRLESTPIFDKESKQFSHLLHPSKNPYKNKKPIPIGGYLVGLSYEPLFKIPALAKNKNAYKIYPADFVTTTDGTGVVHIAVMYGEDDYALGKKAGLPEHHTVDEIGKFTKDVPGGLAGMYVKSAGTEKKIFNYLKKHGNLLRTETYTHEYPHCWRCETPIIYYARNSWFIAMSKLRAQLLASNKKINWIPAHIKEGRFGEWLREAKDWNVSRERYWGAPLPIWECKKCGMHEVVGGLEGLKEKIGTRNTFFFMRHGEAINNVDGVCASIDTKKYTPHLTERGKKEVEATAHVLARKKIDIILSSSLARTKETAAILARATGAKIVIVPELHEAGAGVFNSKKGKVYEAYFTTPMERFQKAVPRGETYNEIKNRMMRAFETINKKYKGKRIIIVSHADPLWLLKGGLEGKTDEKILASPYPETGALYEIDYREVPRDADYRLDVHRPYVDAVVFSCSKCEGKMKRVKEVMDVWFDSGAMPFAQVNFPFAFAQNQKSNLKNQKSKDEFKKLAYPADYICEGMDQTRGWFYTLLAIATALGYEAPYKNVVSLGLINDKFGKKMSKSKGNVVDPWAVIEKYGIDAVRWYFYVATPAGEPKNFDEQEVAKTARRVHTILYNSFIFWQTYAKKSISNFKFSISKNILDVWILARLNETIMAATKQIDAYDIRGAALSIEGLIDDLSRWYIRRSRRRLQRPHSKKDFEAASATLGFVLLETSKLIAPFSPFFAEGLYENFKSQISNLKNIESVHLEDWPLRRGSLDTARAFGSEAQDRRDKSGQAGKEDQKLIKAMAEVRRLASAALAKRAEAKIKVRQPLQTLKVKSEKLKVPQELLEILKDEVNVKEIAFDPAIEGEVELDTTITAELREEGTARELVRTVQELRQVAKLTPQDKIILMAELPPELRGIVERHEKILKADVNAKAIEYKKSVKFTAKIETKLDEQDIWLAVRRA